MKFPRLRHCVPLLVALALPPGVQAAPAPDAPAPTAPALDPTRLLQLAVARNADLAYTRLQSRIAGEGYEAETGLYRPSLYGNARVEGRHRQRSIEEQLAALLGQVPVLDERVRSAEVGVKARAPSGAEMALALRSTHKINNVLAATPLALGDREATGALVLTVRQPLLRGAGRDVVETDLRVADAEQRIAAWQLRQQLIKIGGDALTAFWQLQRAQATQAIRVQALDNARDVLADVRARLQGGRLPPAAEYEAQAAVANREADLARGTQSLSESEARLRTLLDLPPQDGGWHLLAVEEHSGPVVGLEDALQAWPAWRMAQLKREQALLRLRFADDRRRPALDLQGSYSTNGLARAPGTATHDAVRGGHPDWYVGVSFEMPFGGHDVRAEAQYRAQQLKLEQSDLELSAVRVALANDLQSRTQQFDAVGQELAQADAELRARDETLQAEREQFNAGIAPLNRLLRRDAELLEAQLRLADTRARLELARVALQMAQGTLLSTHAVQFED